MRHSNTHRLSYLQALDSVNEQLSRARSLIVSTADACSVSPRYAAVIASVLEMRAARAAAPAAFSSEDLAWFRSPLGTV